jgi:hypothetical protein
MPFVEADLVSGCKRTLPGIPPLERDEGFFAPKTGNRFEMLDTLIFNRETHRGDVDVELQALEKGQA